MTDLKAYAKVNLSLNITGRERLHSIDSVMITVSLFDAVRIESAAEFSVSYDKAIYGGGSVSKAFDAVKSYYAENCPTNEENLHTQPNKNPTDGESLHTRTNKNPTDGESFRALINDGKALKVTVKKGIPIGGGLGGSSADASAVFRYLGVTDKGVMLKAGSDVPFMAIGGAARVRGYGEIVEELDYRYLPLVFLDGGEVSSKMSYDKFDEIYRGFEYCPSDNDRLAWAMKNGELGDIGRQMNNALYAASVKLNPRIAENFAKLSEFSPLGVTMTGSGGGVIALFETDTRAKAVALSCGGQFLYTVKNYRSLAE